MNLGKALRTALDGTLCLVVAPILGLAVVARRLRPRTRPADGARRALVLDSAYSLATMRRRGIERLVTERDLDGYFDHVYTYHPLVGASQEDAPGASPAPFRATPINERHTMLEAHTGLRPGLRLPALNLLLAQYDGFRRVDRIVRREGIGLVRAHDPMYLGLVGRALARANRIPLVVFLQANYDLLYASTGRLAYPRLLRSRRLEVRLARRILRRAELVAGGNQNVLDYGLANGARPERSTLFRIGNAIESHHFEDPSGRARPDDLPVAPGTPFLVYVGRLEHLKHPDDAVHAYAEARRTHPDLALLLVGDGTMGDELEALAKDLDVADGVHLVGSRSQRWIGDTLAHASVLLAPLIGRSLVEGALAGVPIVAYDVEWHSELLSDGDSGALVDYRDWKAMGRRAAALVDDPEEARRMGMAGRAAALDMMDPAKLLAHERAEHERLVYGEVHA